MTNIKQYVLDHRKVIMRNGSILLGIMLVSMIASMAISQNAGIYWFSILVSG